ncbi:hypothetical protein PR202_gb29839 [Eleusine coracana subsp. coracana]|uniref:Hexosyltransferase n=1 Tax=Eleusine coracana subsp. coracana TaxID=191504 RepID=A0AAV5G0N7_ELECO|nr:hypothetical protein PR202_gb29839 [Eleusine coracana subsp. coracana]
MELWREAQMYGDIQLMPFVDYYTLITLKTIAISMFGTQVIPAKYIMKTDDDAFVRIDEEVISSLKKSKFEPEAYDVPVGEAYERISTYMLNADPVLMLSLYENCKITLKKRTLGDTLISPGHQAKLR